MPRLTLLALVAGFLVTWTTSPASASPLCEGASTTGTVVGTHAAGTCVPYSNATLCIHRDAGADPQAHVYTTACVPAP
jgi:hypothetical protein